MTRNSDWGGSDALAARLFMTRAHSQELAAPLSAEDQCVQASEDASPTKWHLAHTTWFFERFILEQRLPGYEIFDPRFNFCFNSYYETQGARHPRPQRGMLTRPSANEVRAYRAHVDQGLHHLFASPESEAAEVLKLIEIGINHEQQHQELLLTDILSLFACSPLKPAWRSEKIEAQGDAPALTWSSIEGGVVRAGHDGERFGWDNEAPRHDTLLHPFRIANRLITNGEWRAFMDDGGYEKATLWLADGWAHVQKEGWRAPLYWQETDGGWAQMTLHGMQEIDAAAPVAHVSYFEVDAYARWAGKRLPTEFEWEQAAALSGANDEDRSAATLFTPRPAQGQGLVQMFGDVWQWTQSAYSPYPGYRPPEGAVGEYNGKFMVSQQVLRGSSCVTPHGHSRPTYRNFFYPWQRWQFMGLRLAEDA
jgi:ergothioneine biosynthesis protein EgtB